MSDEDVGAKPLTAIETYVAPNSPSLGVVRLETKDGSQLYVVTKQIALDLSKVMAQLAEKLSEFQ